MRTKNPEKKVARKTARKVPAKTARRNAAKALSKAPAKVARKTAKKAAGKTAAKTSKKAARSFGLTLGEYSAINEKVPVVTSLVFEQLSLDGHDPDSAKVMGAGYGYSQTLMRGFLTNIRDRLGRHSPSYKFGFDTAFVIAALKMTLSIFIGKINLDTHT